MQFINSEFTSTLEIKKSKFIAFIAPYNSFDSMMLRLKEQHPKARHFVYAYRYLNEFQQIVENSSDDGEPKGTSGRPALSVLSGAELINTAVIIVRYFGGVRLGTGGLVKAYSDAVNLVLNTSELKQYVHLKYKQLEIQYAQLSQIEYIIGKYEIEIIDKQFSQSISLKLAGSEEVFESFSKELFRDNILEDL
ncbi:MAG: YigZ family protein [Arcobacteraceae bacterium]